MKKFCSKLILFCLPIVIICFILIIYFDIFKLFFDYKYYYKDEFIALNRDVVCTNIYKKNRKTVNFNSFIFGNSRSQAFKCEKWQNYLDKESRAFHYDAEGESLFGVCKKAQYISEIGDNIKNALFVIDTELLSVTFNHNGYLYIKHPIVSKESHLKFYWEFIKVNLNYEFIKSYFDYYLTKKYKSYMKYYIQTDKRFQRIEDYINCDIWYGNDECIKKDSLGYYEKLIQKKNFYKRKNPKMYKYTSNDKIIEQLKIIKKIFQKHKTKYKIIISPLYNQKPFNLKFLNILNNIFGEKNVYNFSGKNRFTEPIHNFYEQSHYRPHVANEILDIIYKKNNLSPY